MIGCRIIFLEAVEYPLNNFARKQFYPKCGFCAVKAFISEKEGASAKLREAPFIVKETTGYTEWEPGKAYSSSVERSKPLIKERKVQ